MHLRNLFAATLVAVGLAASNASAATVNYILDLSVDNAFTISAEVSAGDNAGLVFFDVPLTGNVQTLDLRAPLLVNQANFAPAGFNVLRTPAAGSDPLGATANPEIIGSQDAVTGPAANLIYGFGQEASSWAAKGITGVGFPDATTDTSWLAPIVLATGTYDRLAGALAFNLASPNLVANVFAAVDSRDSPAATVTTEVIPFGGPGENLPPVVTDAIIGPPYNANEPGEPQTLTHQFVAVDPDAGQTHTWDMLSLLSYTPNYGAELGVPLPTGPHIAPTLGADGLFSWVSEGSPRGDYVWQVRATDSGTPALSDLGTITVHVTAVPEPSTIALFGLAMVGGLGLIRRRNG